MLSAARMAQMNRLLDEALDLDLEGRRRWLDELSSEYEDLKPALSKALLPDAVAEGSNNLTTLPKVDGAEAAEPGNGLQAGELVGPYRLMRLLGAGGMAEVWLAQRADGAFKREVALKLPMLSRPRKDLASRFAHERDILAGLEHPNIARLYDAGVSREGLPYLAMEYVHGEPLTAWCNAHRLGIRERLKLFLQVLDAVQYAHGHQVIHRDIKPSNILVTETGQARLLDFGVAKLLAREDEQTELTQIYGRALTPDYASPELVRGEVINAAADVYSLGVVLYELLTGSRPYRLKAEASITLLEQAIVTAPVERPSTQLGADAGADRSTTQDKLARRLRGDLDAIVLKALAKEKQERYDSASSLAEDLQRYLSGEPVEARPDSPAYRLGKFVLRHRTGAAAAAVAMLAVAAVVGLVPIRAPAPAPSDTGAGTARNSEMQEPPPVFSPPSHSVAVLPFVNMSGDPKQEYFSDGLSEELLNSLTSIRDLQVAARTSSFFFKGKDRKLADIARELNVGALLEGSVRKDGTRVRITAQLVNAVTGFHLWSQTYDRDLKDVLKLQTEIATAVTKALQATLLADEAATIELGGTQNPQALDAYLRGLRWKDIAHTREEYATAIGELSEAIRLDPHFARAYASKAMFLAEIAGYVPESDLRKTFEQARATAEQAVALAPGLADAHVALALVLEQGFLDVTHAAAEYDRALALSPGDAWVQMITATFFAVRGRANDAVAGARRAVVLDPLSARVHRGAGNALHWAHRYREAIVEFDRALSLNSELTQAASDRGLALLALGELEAARQSCADPPIDWQNHLCLAIALDKLHLRAEAEKELATLKAENGDLAAVQYAEIYAQWGDIPRGLDWIEKTYQLKDPGLLLLKVDNLLDPLRKEPRFQQIEHKLKFPT